MPRLRRGRRVEAMFNDDPTVAPALGVWASYSTRTVEPWEPDAEEAREQAVCDWPVVWLEWGDRRLAVWRGHRRWLNDDWPTTAATLRAGMRVAMRRYRAERLRALFRRTRRERIRVEVVPVDGRQPFKVKTTRGEGSP